MTHEFDPRAAVAVAHLSHSFSIYFLERPTKPACPDRALQGKAVRLQLVRVLHRQEGQAQKTPVNGSQPGSFSQKMNGSQDRELV